MKFVHIADMHMDSPFTFLNNKLGLGDARRAEQKDALKKIINYIKENNIEYLFIAGDFFEQEYVRESTINYINSQFETIPNTKIFITPGNHDPYIKNSYYSTFNWNNNVHIFKGNFEKYEEKDVDIYGMGFTDFYLPNSNINNLKIENKNKLNILIMHCSLNASKQDNNFSYNPVSTKEIEELGFDYVALGHIHNMNYSENNKKIIYPGSTISLGFDELGEHGMIVGEIDKNNTELNFVKLDNRVFLEKEIDVTEIYSIDELIQVINELYENQDYMYKIILIGKRNFSIDVQALLKNINNNNILKIENNTKIKYDLEELSKEISLRGIFVKECLKRFESSEYTKKEIEKAIEIGLETM